ncbi:MAG: prepilin-type N-terminal cleavage/methylation domain-containing protein [Planctomycetota bacterium]|jgi:prepilin-type N-terminal cleavage/methylation domain-containing protein/prepilin-type processing-associated H-X9-DG protein
MRKKGFTLIELLVVISIIALLLSILMPGLQKAKAAAKNLVCRNNLKQLANAFHSYYLDYNDKALVSTGDIDFWFLQLGPYLSDAAFTQKDYDDGKDPESLMKSSMAVNKCPATKPPENEWDSSQPPWSPVNTTGGTAKNQYRYHMVRVEGSYAMNRWAGGWGAEDNGTFDPATRKGQVNLPKSYRNSAPGGGNIPLLADAIWVDALPKSGDIVPDDLSEPGFGSEETNELQRFCSDRHGLDTNVAYCDGHVEKIKLKELWTQRWSKDFKFDRDVQVPKDRGD